MPSQRENLSRNKEMVLAAMKSKGHTNRFKAFCKSETMDQFLHSCIDYFLVFFKLIEEKEKAKNSAERRDALAEGKAPPPESGSPSDAAPPPANAPSSREIYELEIEQRSRLKDVALVYATILLKNSNYANTQQERQFFESLYDFAKRVLFTINQRKNWHAIENELDRVFRSPHFNLSQRKNDQNLKGGSQGAQSFKEMYEKRQGQDAFGLAHRAHRSSIHQALQMRSPIISEIFPTPEERFEREKQRKEQEDAQAAEDAALGVEPLGATHASDDGWADATRASQPAARATSREQATAYGGGGAGGPPLILDGEEAMEAIVQDASAAFNEVAR